MFKSPSVRRAITATLACGMASAMCLTSLPANAVQPGPAATSTDAGLFGASDPSTNGVYRQSLALLALVPTNTAPPREAVSWLLSQQCTDGGFQIYKPTGAECSPPDSTNWGGEDSDTTGIALEALVSVGERAAAQDAARWLVLHQNNDQGFAYYPDQVTNTANPPVSDANSTAVALMGLNAFNNYAATQSPPITGYPAQADAARTFLATLQIAHCPSDAGSSTNDGAFGWQDHTTVSHYATVQASFAIGGHLLTDGPFGTPNIVEPGFTCTNPPVLDPSNDRALISAGYISSWIDTANGNPFVDDPADEPAWAALSMIAGGVTPQSSIDTALAAMQATVGTTSTDAGDLAIDILARHAQPGSATDVQIPQLTSRLLKTLAPVNSVAPKVSGTVKVGETVSCNPGTWTKSPTGFTFTWYRGASTVIGRAATLKLTPALVSQSIHCAVKAANGFGSTTVTSAASKVAIGVLTNVSLPMIVGNVRVGAYIAATSGSWKPLPTKYKFVWKRGNTVVGTGIGYRVKSADRGQKLTVTVTVSTAGYTGTATSKSRSVR